MKEINYEKMKKRPQTDGFPSPRRSMLLQAADIVDGDRTTSYGRPEDSFRTIAGLWNAYLKGRPPEESAILPHDVAAMMALLKLARIAGSGGDHPDSWLDLAGYAACGRELAG